MTAARCILIVCSWCTSRSQGTRMRDRHVAPPDCLFIAYRYTFAARPGCLLTFQQYPFFMMRGARRVR